MSGPTQQPSTLAPDPARIDAPWTPEQVENLNYFQDSGAFHPFTSTNGDLLIATADGWVEREGGPVVQTWAHTIMADRNAIDQQVALLNGTFSPPSSDKN